MVKMITAGWVLDTCNCHIIYEWDEDLPPALRVLTINSIVHQCSAHNGIVNISDLWIHVVEQNKRKNRSLRLAREALGYDSIEEFIIDRNVTWDYTGSDENRVLEISVPGIIIIEKTQIQDLLDLEFGTGKVVII